MTEISKDRAQKIQQWNKIIFDFTQSGMNRKLFCKTYALNYDHFQYYLHRNKNIKPKPVALDFIPVVCKKADVVPRTSCKIHLKNAISLEIVDLDIAVLCNLLNRLGAL